MKNNQKISSRYGITAIIGAAITLSFTACTTTKLSSQLPDFSVDQQQGAVQNQGTVYFVATDGLPIYAGTSSAAKVLGQLPLHTKVIRTRLEKGYAFVRTADGRFEGWVNNNQLDWRVPTAKKPGKDAADQKPPSLPGEPEQELPAVTEPGPVDQGQQVEEPKAGDTQEVVSGDSAAILPEEMPAEPEKTSVSPAESVDAVAPVRAPKETATPTSGESLKPAPSIFDSF